MGVELRNGPAGRRLNSWKEIATFFGCDERTVRRWEAARRLPVRRLPNGPRSSVFAYEGELKAWLDKSGDVELSVPAIAQVETLSARLHGPRSGYAAALAAAVIFVIGVVAAIPFGWHSSNSTGQQPLHAAAAHTPSAEAQSFYRAGLYAWQTRTPVGLTRAVDEFTQAIVHDPQYAEAYAGLASCYNLLREYTTMAPDYAFPRAKSAAERAIALNPSLADAHASLAFVDFYWLRDIASARREYARAVTLSSRNATAHHWYATFLLSAGEFPQAVTEIELAEALDTESTAIRADKGYILSYAGRTDEAVVLLRQLEQTQPLFASPHFYLAMIYRARGNDSDYLHELDAWAKSRSDDAYRAIAASGISGLAAGGHIGMLKAILATERQLFVAGKLSAFALAETYAEIGDARDALKFLRTSLDRNETESVSLAIEPAFHALRPNPAFRALAAIAMTPISETPRKAL